MKQRTSNVMTLVALALVAQVCFAAAQGLAPDIRDPAAVPATRDRTTGPTNPNPNPTSELSTSGQRQDPGDNGLRNPERSGDRAPRPDNTKPASPPLR